MSEVTKDEIRQSVRDAYKKVVAPDKGSCCGGSTSTISCLGTGEKASDISMKLGYSNEDVNTVPDGANMGLGCGNPQAIAKLKIGETVMDLGSGGGFDSFLAAKQVGPSGHVIGVDMTPEMITQARKNILKTDFKNVEFRLGEIEHIPVADNSVDVIMSNCVINLSPDKSKVYQDAFRVLKKGGRLAISDVVATAEMPDKIKKDMELYSGCVSGASLITDIETMLKNAGFIKIKIEPKDESREFIKEWVPGGKIEDFVVSATIEAVKPL